LVGFFFQAEDGIRVFHVTGVQTCALPISARPEVPDELEAIVASALAKDRDARTADADELARQLLGFASWTGGPLRHADVAQTLRSEERRVGEGRTCRWSAAAADIEDTAPR